VLTILGIATAITTLVGLVGILDTALLTLDRTEEEAFQDYPDRMTVYLNNFYPLTHAEAFVDSPAISMAEPAVRLGGKVMRGDVEFAVMIDALDLDNELWTPTVIAGSRHSTALGVLLSEKAADDLGIEPGDTITLEHPRRTGLFAYDMVRTEVKVSGIHADAWRTTVYMDLDQVGMMGLEGVANIIHVNPAAGISRFDAKNAMFQYPSVASVIAVFDAVQANRSILDEVLAFLSGVEIAVFVLAFLIAFNSTNINMSERAREIATMFAFGLHIRTVTRMAMLENLITGILGTLIGTGLGVLTLFWFFVERMPEIVPEAQFNVTLSPTTALLTVLLGVIVVALTPLLTVRKMVRMDIPSTLRVME
jgi:putative ABC transport system permease protein